MNLQLIRWCYGPECTLGLLKFGDELQYSAWTVEKPYRDNQIFVSCVPDGGYPLVAFDSADHPDCWCLTPIEGRTGILIHIGNSVDDVTGCIAIGLERTEMKVWRSADALKMLNYVVNRNEQHTIAIGPGMAAVAPADKLPAGDDGVRSGSVERPSESEMRERDRDSRIPPTG